MLEDQLKKAGYIECTREDLCSWGASTEVQDFCNWNLINIARQSLHGIVGKGRFEWAQWHEDVDTVIDQLQSEVHTGFCIMAGIMR